MLRSEKPRPPRPPPRPVDISDANTERRLSLLCTENPNGFFTYILDIICSPTADSQRRFQAAVALRHFLRPIPEVWPRLNTDIKSRLRDDLIWINFFNALVEEETRSLLGPLRDIAIELGSYLLPDDSWPEIYSSLTATSPRVRESALFIFSRLGHLIKWQSILPQLDLLRSLIRSSLNSKFSGVDDPDERNAALLAAITLIHIVPPSEDCKKLQDLLPDMISVLQQAFTSNHQELAKEAVIALTNLIAVKPKFISPCLSKVLEVMLHIAEFDKENKELRREAVNLVVTLAKKEPVMVEQQLVPSMGRFVAILLEMLSDMEDYEDKGTGEDAKMFSNALSAALGGDLLVPVLIKLFPGYLEDDEDKDTGEENNFKYAKTFSNALSAALGGDLLVPELIMLLPGYLRDSDWKKRHAALFFLKEIAKGWVEALKEHLEQIVNMIVALFKDKHPRVKWAALTAMRELLVHLKSDLEDQYHETIFPALLQAMRFDCPHIQVEAAWAAWYFMRWCSKDIFKFYLSEIFDGLYTMIQAGNSVVQDNALLILGFVPTLLKERMGISYVENMYNYTMPNLKFCLNLEISEVDPDRRLCAHSVQRQYYMGTGLGKDLFRNDAKEVIEEMMSFKGPRQKALCMGISYVENMYNYTMPNLKFFLNPEISKVDPDRRLCAHSVQRKYYIGDGLGKDLFRNDAKEVIEEMLSFKGPPQKALCMGISYVENMYNYTMPNLKFFLNPEISEVDPDRRLCAHSVQRKYYIGEGLGKDLFRNDAKEVIEEMMSFKGPRQKALCMGISYVENMYNYTMPDLKFFLNPEISEVDPDRRLCANSVQRKYYMGAGLGKDLFRNDAKEVIQEMMSFKGAMMKAREPATGDLLKTWMGQLNCLDQEFLPYMEHAIPPLLQYAQSDSERIISNMDTEVKSAKGAGEKLLDEKASACNILYSYDDDEPQHASSTDTPAASVFRQLAELRTACARARLPLPPVDISRVLLINSVRFAPQLAELAGSDIAPCLVLVGSISWQRLRSDYQQLGRAYSDYAQTLASIELDLTQARQTLSFLERRFIQEVTWRSHLGAVGASLEALEHAARLITMRERDLDGAYEVVSFYSSLHQECSRAHAEAGARFTAMLMHDRSRRERIEGHLGRIAKVLEELASYS